MDPLPLGGTASPPTVAYWRRLLGRSSNCRYSTYYPAVAVGLTYAEGLTSICNTYFVYEDGSWRHRFSQEEYDLFMPDASYEEFVKAQ
jgi:hypothetical protein